MLGYRYLEFKTKVGYILRSTPMQLTRFTDYSLRVLMYLALNGGRSNTIRQIAGSYDISKNHLMKVVHHLVLRGYICSVRGRTGGLQLAMPASEIILGEVVRQSEESFRLVECFDIKRNTCCISRSCGLRRVLDEALLAFLSVLDQYTLADLVSSDRPLRRILGIGVP